VATSALGSHCERVENNLTYLSFSSVNAPYGPQNTVIVVCCGNKIKDRQLEQSKRVYVVTTDRFEDCLFCNVQQYLQDICIPCIVDSLPFLIIT